jgi:hypothetical protein
MESSRSLPRQALQAWIILACVVVVFLPSTRPALKWAVVAAALIEGALSFRALRGTGLLDKTPGQIFTTARTNGPFHRGQLDLPSGIAGMVALLAVTVM